MTELEDYGFQYRRENTSRGIWVNEKQRVVIKKPYILRTSSIPAAAAPTIIIYNKGHPILIQVLCELPITCDEMYELVEKMEKRNRHSETDINENNVGLYRNQPVLFDW